MTRYFDDAAMAAREGNTMNNTTTTHTPGPWRRGQEVQFGPRFSGVTIRGSSTVAIVVEGSGRADANARLIAAAPELLDALKGIVEAVDPAIGGGTLEDWATGPVTAARAAIARATGEEVSR